VVSLNTIITPALISMIASVGKEYLSVKKLPQVVIISSGDELVNIGDLPTSLSNKAFK
jgi:molybdopterin molybdotransferase